VAERSGVFDMIGPIMIGPSSSHTAGVVRIGRVAKRMLGGNPVKAVITFYNSFARTYEGHGSDRAIVAGLLDFKTDDKRIKEAFEYAAIKGLEYTFKSVGNASTMHPNSVKLQLTGEEGRTVEVVGESRGGGLIKIKEVNGFEAHFTASMHTLMVLAKDKVGSVAFITNVISQDEANIATMSVSRKGKFDVACQFYEMDSGLRPLTLDYLKSLHWVEEVTYIPDIDL